MLFLQYFTSLCPLFLSYHAAAATELEKRQGPATYYAITGPTGGVHPRLEIRELQADGIMWNLFLLALREFQAMDQKDIDSYYRIAGIHGMPWYDWDGVLFNPSNAGPPQVGYCMHHDLLFSTWHRPYILLFEQKLQSLAIQIANDFGDPSYRAAANRLRLPFWDWAQAVSIGEPVFPAALSTPTVAVTLRDGSIRDIDNPLYDYDFHPLDNSQINGTGCNFLGNAAICNRSQRTVRRAVTVSGAFVSNHTAIESDLRGQLNGLRQSVYSAITQYHSFNDFSNDGNCRESQLPSIEMPHNSIHNAMNPGHMSPPPTSAFDPLFWLHHSNVDRQIALFQALFPTTYLEPCTAKQSTWTIQPGEFLDIQSPLTPFRRASGEWWTSASSRNIVDLGYTYPELLDRPSNKTLISRINALYRDSRLAAKNKKLYGTVQDVEYIVQVMMPVSTEFSYNVVLFLGDVHDNPAGWASQDSFIAKTSSMMAMTAQNSSMTVGTVLINKVVAKILANAQIHPGGILDYLKGNLHWRLELGDLEMTRNAVSGVKVTLMSTEVERATTNLELDRWVGGFTVLGNIA